jgi:hypothetical protein
LYVKTIRNQRSDKLQHLITGLQLEALGKAKETSIVGKGGGTAQGVGRKKVM